jgi:thiol-disulfide isomerase/thioredoxin
MDCRLRNVIPVLVVLALLTASPAAARSNEVKPRGSALPFVVDLEPALESAAAEGRPVFLAFGAAWCPVCRQMEERTLLEPPVQAFADDFVWVKVDIDRRVSLAREWEVVATPTIFLLGPMGDIRRKIVGGIGAEALAEALGSVLEAPSAASAPGEAPVIQVHRATSLTEAPRGFRGRSICFSNVGYGPLAVRSQSPLQGLRLSILPRTPSTLAGGDHELKLATTWANLWAVDEEAFDPANDRLGPYVIDSESLDLDLSYAYGLSDIFELEFVYEQRWRFGGVMDGFIEGFHDLFGLGQAGRDLWPRDQSFISIDPGDGGPPLARDDSADHTIAQSVLATFQHNVSCGGERHPAFSWSATVRAGVGGEELQGSDFDLAVSAAASQRFGRFYVYLTLGYAWFGSDAIDGIALEDNQLTVLAAGEWRFAPRMSLVLQYLGSQGAAVDPAPFNEFSHELVVGWKWELRPAGVLELGLIENIITFDNSPDFGVHAAFIQRF